MLPGVDAANVYLVSFLQPRVALGNLVSHTIGDQWLALVQCTDPGNGRPNPAVRFRRSNLWETKRYAPIALEPDFARSSWVTVSISLTYVGPDLNGQLTQGISIKPRICALLDWWVIYVYLNSCILKIS